MIALVFVLLALTLSLFVAFRQWKDRHLELATYGAERVAPAILPLAKLVPGGATPDSWSRVVDQMRLVLTRVTGAGSFDLKDMQNLRRDLQLRVDRAFPETAAETLETLWEDLERRHGPNLTAHPVVGLGSAVTSLAGKPPNDVDPRDWALALVQTRAMLVALGDSGALSKDQRRQLNDAIEARARAQRDGDAWNTLMDIWTMVDESCGLPAGFARPSRDRSVERES